jgi:hypothetical protein
MTTDTILTAVYDDNYNNLILIMNNSTDFNLPNIKIYDTYNFQLIREFNILKPMINNQMIHKVQIIDQ